MIEYNGDDYHGNPNKYKPTDKPNPFRKNITAQEIWDRDKRKKLLAEQHGFEVLVIWDSEYRWGNKQEIINRCLDFLGKK
jgi:G:T-mismatch repair DNA endonuclease (very short patch repair protein)